MTSLAEARKVIAALKPLVEEETRRLSAGDFDGLDSVVASKVRLVDQFVGLMARIEREGAAAFEGIDQSSKEAFLNDVRDVLAAGAENGHVLERQKAVTEDVLGFVLAQARKTSQATSRRYGERGVASEIHRPTAVVYDAKV